MSLDSSGQKLFVDVGASLGWFSLLMGRFSLCLRLVTHVACFPLAAKGRRVVAIEALQSNVERLLLSACLNHLYVLQERRTRCVCRSFSLICSLLTAANAGQLFIFANAVSDRSGETVQMWENKQVAKTCSHARFQLALHRMRAWGTWTI